MEIARPVALETDFEAELLAAYPNLTRRLAVVLRDWAEAEDIAQSAFARALERRERFRGGDVRAWLYTIGLRLALNELRRRRRVETLADMVMPDWALRSQPDLWMALERIAPNQRAALLLSALDGYTHDEIGTILGVPAGTVSSWLSRTKDSLRTTLGDER
jgi:RNA polymerase sigma-70 factor (ECF subfamily)